MGKSWKEINSMTWAVNSLPIMALTSSIHLCFCGFFYFISPGTVQPKSLCFAFYLSGHLFSFFIWYHQAPPSPIIHLNFIFVCFISLGNSHQYLPFSVFVPSPIHSWGFSCGPVQYYLSDLIFSCCLRFRKGTGTPDETMMIQ